MIKVPGIKHPIKQPCTRMSISTTHSVCLSPLHQLLSIEDHQFLMVMVIHSPTLFLYIPQMKKIILNLSLFDCLYSAQIFPEPSKLMGSRFTHGFAYLHWSDFLFFLFSLECPSQYPYKIQDFPDGLICQSHSACSQPGSVLWGWLVKVGGGRPKP